MEHSSNQTGNHSGNHSGGGSSYWRFMAMVATSTAIMFGLMYLNTYLLSHVFWSETRAYMALLMGATMAIIMMINESAGSPGTDSPLIIFEPDVSAMALRMESKEKTRFMRTIQKMVILTERFLELPCARSCWPIIWKISFTAV